MSVPPLGFACKCGALHGHVDGATPRSGTHLVCYCADCRAAQLYFGQPDPAPEGVEIYQTTPDTITIEAGRDHLGLFRLGPKGLFRWYAACCNTPLFNTLSSARLPFVGIHVDRLDNPEQIGPVVVRSFVPQHGGTAKHKNAGVMVWRLITSMGAARLSGRWRKTPFFDTGTGAPVATAVIPDKAERAALYPKR